MGIFVVIVHSEEGRTLFSFSFSFSDMYFLIIILKKKMPKRKNQFEKKHHKMDIKKRRKIATLASEIRHNKFEL